MPRTEQNCWWGSVVGTAVPTCVNPTLQVVKPRRTWPTHWHVQNLGMLLGGEEYPSYTWAWIRGKTVTYHTLKYHIYIRFASSGCQIDRPWPACQLDSAARQVSSKNQTGLGHPAGAFKKSNFTRPPRGRTIYFDFRPRPPPSVPYSII